MGYVRKYGKGDVIEPRFVSAIIENRKTRVFFAKRQAIARTIRVKANPCKGLSQ